MLQFLVVQKSSCNLVVVLVSIVDIYRYSSVRNLFKFRDIQSGKKSVNQHPPEIEPPVCSSLIIFGHPSLPLKKKLLLGKIRSFGNFTSLVRFLTLIVSREIGLPDRDVFGSSFEPGSGQ